MAEITKERQTATIYTVELTQDELEAVRLLTGHFASKLRTDRYRDAAAAVAMALVPGSRYPMGAHESFEQVKKY